MHRRLRVDVVEGERELVLVDLLARQLAAQDAREDVVAVVVGHGPGLARGRRSVTVTRHFCLRAAFSAMPDRPSRRASSVHTALGLTPTAAHRVSRW